MMAKYYYFVFFEHTKGSGSSEIWLNQKIANIEQIRAIEKHIVEADKMASQITISNYIFLREE